jgi:hypothetical protein
VSSDTLIGWLLILKAVRIQSSPHSKPKVMFSEKSRRLTI